MARSRLSVIVACHNMRRELPRTLYTLSPAYQRGIAPDEYDVVVVDNGSTPPVSSADVSAFGPNFHLTRSPLPTPSPASGINAAARAAAGDVIVVCIDGARMLTPGILRLTAAAFRAFDDPVVATLSWHLGPKLQNQSLLEGYDQRVEDALLDSVDWRRDGYELFRISTLAASSGDGWFLPAAESNCLALSRSAFAGLGGLDERFRSAGGGLVALDFYRRACESRGELVLLLGEGTFHQFHGGVATNAPPDRHPFSDFHREYVALRGKPFAAPRATAIYLGTVPPQAMPFLKASAEAALAIAPADGS